MVALGVTLALIMGSMVYASGIGGGHNPAKNIESRLDGESIIVYMEEGGTVTIVHGMELVRFIMGFLSIADIEIINDSNVTDAEFFARLERGHFFGYGGVSALSIAGLLEGVDWGWAKTGLRSTCQSANADTGRE